MNYLVSIRLNNNGAELLAQGKIAEGRAVLIKALKQTKLITMQLYGREGSFRKEKKCVSCGSKTFVSFHWLKRIDDQVPSSDESCTVFQRPIQIMEYHDIATMSFVNDISCAIIFNLSLAFHTESLLTANSSLLEKALQGYYTAVELRRVKARKHPQSARQGLLDLALLNNVGHVHVERCDYSNAMPYFRSLARLVMRNSIVRDEEVDAKDRVGFIMGAKWRPPSCAPMA